MSVDFYLTGLNSQIESALATIESAPHAGFVYDATAECDIAVADVNATFQFQTDSTDFSNAAASDIKYYVIPVAGNYMGLGAAWNPVTNTELAAKSGSETWGPDGEVNAAGSAYATKPPKQDFVRHLAKVLFGTQFGVDLFQNEEELVAALVADASGVIQGKIDTAAASVMTNAESTDANLSRELMFQLLDAYPERFVDISNTGLQQKLPILAGDSISFRLIVVADASQASSTTGASNVRLTSPNEVLAGLTLNRLDKVYRIKLNVV